MLVATLITACVDSVAPRSKSPVASDLALDVSTQTVTFSLPVPEHNSPNYGALAPIASGLFLDQGDHFRLRIAPPGEISGTYSGMCAAPLIDRPDFVVNPNGNPDGLVVQAHVGTQTSGVFEADIDGSWVAIGQANNAGGLSVGRTGYVDHCVVGEQQLPTYALSGSQTVTVDFVGVVVSPSASTIYEGASVIYSATPVHFPAASVRGVSWGLMVGDGLSYEPIAACQGQLTCTYTPTKSGTVVAAVETMGGVVQGKSALTVVKCPVKDPRDTLLNNPEVRSALQAAVNAAGTFTKLPADRREIGGAISRDKITGALHFTPVTITKSTPCEFAGTFQTPAGDSLVALYHVHPFDAGGAGKAAETFPSACGKIAGESYDPRPSETADWPMAVNFGVPYYYIDAREVGVADGSDPTAKTSPEKWGSLARKYPWNTAACKW